MTYRRVDTYTRTRTHTHTHTNMQCVWVRGHEFRGETPYCLFRMYFVIRRNCRTSISVPKGSKTSQSIVDQSHRRNHIRIWLLNNNANFIIQ